MADIVRLSAAGDLLSKVTGKGPRLSHEDMYRAGAALTEITYQLDEIAREIFEDVKAYPSSYVLRDDQGKDPQKRIEEALDQLTEISVSMQQANRRAKLYHSAVGHIGVEVNPDAEEDQ
jgi:hypothetical protein